MKNIFDHIEYVKGKPHHIRRKVAFAAAAGMSGVVAFVWLASSLATGAFVIQGSSLADATGQQDVVATTSDSGDQGLAGVGSAAVLQDGSAPAHIEVVDTTPPAPVKKTEQTVLPF